MKKSVIAVLEILSILLMVIFVSGCTETGVTENRDIILNGTPNIYKSNASSDEWIVNGTVISRANRQYSNLTLYITAYDAQGNVIDQTTFNIPNLNHNASFQAVIKSNVTVDHVKVTAGNAQKTA